MALFVDDPSAPRRDRPVARAGWIVLLIALVIAFVLAIVPAPYVIDKPGPVFNTLGSTDAVGQQSGKDVPLISIDGEPVYPTKGSLDLLTVSQVGSPSQRPNWLGVIRAWFDTSAAVIPIDKAFPPQVTQKEVAAQSEAAMVNSQQDAIAAALTHLGYDFPISVSVVGVPDGSPSTGVLEAGDSVDSVNGTAVASIAELRAALQKNGAGTEAHIGITRDGAHRTVAVTPTSVGDTVVAGINVKMEYRFPFDVEIQLDKVGGPSAGMMFALGIIDKLTPGAIQGGEDVAGTGTIDPSGTVGPIGGIQQKLYGAKRAGAEWFLAPAANCAEVTGHVPDGLTVFAVQTLDDSITALDAIRTGEGVSELPTCPAS
ncbi:YlbL family protein [Cryobacterium tepidiphilum]|uniref:endopeptidase La n=1 Tax=Cryobacterium tepidiphilum TaxID=2486026 RepID=A0A3M8L2U7_9MICO|nr:S16 family serine protease [Cryobacterium tepidiphilum]RNE59052.1 PDZ domain-containing protein [Cryobacterium tepidiphilum]